MTNDVVAREVGEVPLAVIRRQARQADLPRLVPECCGRVWEALRAQGARGGRHVALYLDGSIRLEVGVELAGPFAPSGEVVRSALPAGRVATTAHFGPYQTLGAAHTAIQAWCRNEGLALAGPSWEVYDHWRDEWNADPSLIRTDVFYQLTTERMA